MAIIHMQELHDIKKKVDDIHGFIFGNSNQPNSVNVRLDRLEQKQENRKWAIGIISTVVGGLGLDRLVQWLKHM